MPKFKVPPEMEAPFFAAWLLPQLRGNAVAPDGVSEPAWIGPAYQPRSQALSLVKSLTWQNRNLNKRKNHLECRSLATADNQRGARAKQFTMGRSVYLWMRFSVRLSQEFKQTKKPSGVRSQRPPLQKEVCQVDTLRLCIRCGCGGYPFGEYARFDQ